MRVFSFEGATALMRAVNVSFRSPFPGFVAEKATLLLVPVLVRKQTQVKCCYVARVWTTAGNSTPHFPTLP